MTFAWSEPYRDAPFCPWSDGQDWEKQAQENAPTIGDIPYLAYFLIYFWYRSFAVGMPFVFLYTYLYTSPSFVDPQLVTYILSCISIFVLY